MKLNRGRDRVVQSARIKYGKSMLERTIQYFHPMELFYDLVWRTEKDAATLNVNTREYVTEQTKAVAAKLQIREATPYSRTVFVNSRNKYGESVRNI